MMSSNTIDNELSELLWQGCIPILFKLSDNDVASSNKHPNPVFKLASRFSYLPVICSDVIAHLQSFVLQYTSDVWYEYNSIPLKTNLPVGVLYDMSIHNNDNDDNKLPIWTITIHFQTFPRDIIPCSTLSDSERYFSHSLKQALYLLHGSTSAYNSLTVELKKSFWDSVCSGSDYQTFQSISSDLLLISTTVNKLPIRFIKQGYPTRQISIEVLKNEDEILLSDVISQLNDNDIKSSDQYKLLVHGIDITCHLNVPIQELWRRFHHGDFFMYIIILIC